MQRKSTRCASYYDPLNCSCGHHDVTLGRLDHKAILEERQILFSPAVIIIHLLPYKSRRQ